MTDHAAILQRIVQHIMGGNAAPSSAGQSDVSGLLNGYNPNNYNVHQMWMPNSNNFDPMVAPPYGLPPDKNSMMPDDVSSYRGAFPWQKQRGL